MSATKDIASSSRLGRQAGDVGAVAAAHVEDADDLSALTASRSELRDSPSASPSSFSGGSGLPVQLPGQDHRLDLQDRLVGDRTCRSSGGTGPSGPVVEASGIQGGRGA
jgi:hypothetical protein